MAASLCVLPPELISCILSSLEKPDVKNVCLVSKCLYCGATDAFYSDIEINLNDYQHKQSPLKRFLRTLLDKDWLGYAVKQFALLGDECQGDSHHVVGDSALLQLSKDQFEQASSTSLDALNGSNLLLVALILAKLPNIQYLRLGIKFLTMSASLGVFLGCGLTIPGGRFHANSLSTLSHLTHVVFAPIVDLDGEGRKAKPHFEDVDQYLDWPPDGLFADRPIDSLQAIALFYLPVIQSIDILLPSSARRLQWPGDRPHTVTLTILILRSTTCGEDTIEELLRVTPNLKKLSYERFYDPNELPERRLPNPRRLYIALQHVKRTLEELVIRIEVYY